MISYVKLILPLGRINCMMKIVYISQTCSENLCGYHSIGDFLIISLLSFCMVIRMLYRGHN